MASNLRRADEAMSLMYRLILFSRMIREESAHPPIRIRSGGAIQRPHISHSERPYTMHARLLGQSTLGIFHPLHTRRTQNPSIPNSTSIPFFNPTVDSTLRYPEQDPGAGTNSSNDLSRGPGSQRHRCGLRCPCPFLGIARR